MDLIYNILTPIVVAIVTYILFNKLDEHRKRRSNSVLGALIMDTLIEEVERGREIILGALDPSNKDRPIKLLPDKSWGGVSTIPDAVLLRIVAVSKNVKPRGYKPRQIRSHAKNYFEMMASNWNRAISDFHYSKDQLIKVYPTYGEAATGVLRMLEQAKELLEENSKKVLPK